MTTNLKFKTLFIALVAILGLSVQSCGDDNEPVKPEVNVNAAPSFKVVNTSVTSEKELSATDSKLVVNLTYNITITDNGESQTYSITCSSNELPVLPGNEVKITAYFGKDTATDYVCFTMPDGKKEMVSKDSPECIWTVPTSFVSNQKITAQWADKNGEIQHSSLSSSITMIELKK